jgi:hypothetical protein
MATTPAEAKRSFFMMFTSVLCLLSRQRRHDWTNTGIRNRAVNQAELMNKRIHGNA